MELNQLQLDVVNVSPTDLATLGTAIEDSTGKLEGDLNVSYVGSFADFAGLTGTAQVRTTQPYNSLKKTAFDSLVTAIIAG